MAHARFAFLLRISGTMKTQFLSASFLAVALSVTAVAVDEKRPGDDKTLGEKTSETLKKAGEKTKDAGRAVVEGTKEAGRAAAEGSRKAADAVKDAVTPDADAQRVEVTLNEERIEVPKEIAAGKTAFVVRNNGSKKQNFHIAGHGVDKKFMTAVDPNESKTLHVNLKPGTYQVQFPDRKIGGSSIVVK